MNKKLNTQKQLSHKVIIFWSAIGLLTLAFIVTVLVMFLNNRPVNSLDDLRNLREERIFEQGDSYYIYVYSKLGITESQAELEKAEDLEELILTYMTYVKRNSQAKPIYGMIVDSASGNYGNHSVLFEGSGKTEVLGKSVFSTLRINKDDVPILLLVENKKISKAYLTEKEIRDALDSQMNP